MISLIIGLGNIGRKYAATRHNLGFMVIDRLIERAHAAVQPRVDEYDWATFEVEGRPIILAKPRTYMNLSGLAAARLLEEHSLTPDQMLVIVDDFAIPLGAVRIRGKGSSGGHNGLTSIAEETGTQSFPRMRLGIGQARPTINGGLQNSVEIGRQTSPSAPSSVQAGSPAAQSEGSAPKQSSPKPVDNEADIIDFVLSPFETEERPVVDKMILHAADAVLFVIEHRLEETMSKYNVNPASPDSL